MKDKLTKNNFKHDGTYKILFYVKIELPRYEYMTDSWINEFKKNVSEYAYELFKKNHKLP